ncbi:hypothetical protein C8N36_10675 [Pelagimonas varians]|uniref:Uncharacterized protein n=1 Tax=Pelagimonas varians TaxID=696760 RepID=A0A238K4Y5_9RHOB|nr:hypothetical protein C8N36_10675 [Pelagimonas varians]SMX37833.1 hypothetical protein PEV8663_01215 [Pelagimonas varians]
MRRNELLKPEKPSQQIADLVYRIHRLCPDHRNPHRFHEEKSEIAYDLSELARQVN